MIKKCTCEHKFQDKVHGKGKRVMNETGGNKGRELKGWRCTVCGKVVTE